MNLKKFEHKHILITGASSGIGEAIAYQLARINASLYLVGRNRERLTDVRNKCIAINADATPSPDTRPANEASAKNRTSATTGTIQLFQVDFADMISIDKFVAEVNAQNIAFDYIILNAGISQRARTLETDFSVDRNIMETNYFGPVYLTKKLLGTPHATASVPGVSNDTTTSTTSVFETTDAPVSGSISEKPVHIAVTSSISGLFGFPLRSAYCASKHALFGFFESLELENKHIKVTFLIPGRINTPISKSAVLGDGSTYARMDSGQADGMDVNKCARIALHAIAKEKHRKLIGGKELLMVYFKKFIPPLFYKLARNISAT